MRLKLWFFSLFLTISALHDLVYRFFQKSFLVFAVLQVVGACLAAGAALQLKNGFSGRRGQALDDGDPRQDPVRAVKRRSKWYYPATWFSGREGVAVDDAVNVYGELVLPVPDDVRWSGPPFDRTFSPVRVMDGARLYIGRKQLPVNRQTLRYCEAVRAAARRVRLSQVVRVLDAVVQDSGGGVRRDAKKS